MAKTKTKPKTSGERNKHLPAGRPGVPTPIDIHVGQRVRMRRTILGITQEKLAHVIGVSFQQVQKYERGVNRMGSSRLYDMANVLNVPVQYFFDEMDKKVADQAPRLRAGLSEVPDVEQPNDPMAKRETLELVRAYYKVTDYKMRKGVLDLLRTMSKTNE